jgi:hypothetical protein
MGSNLGHHCGKLETNRAVGTAYASLYFPTTILLCALFPEYVVSKFSTPIEASLFISIKAVKKIKVGYIYIILHTV